MKRLISALCVVFNIVLLNKKNCAIESCIVLLKVKDCAMNEALC